MPSWTTCAECEGARVQGEHCLAHLTGSEFATEIARLSDGGALDARGVTFDRELLRALLDQLRLNEDSRPQFSGDADFSGAQFSGDADFSGAQFTGTADIHLGGARLRSADFRGAQFTGDADFSVAQFTGPADFLRAQFSGAVSFRGAQFSGFADFGAAHFTGHAYFSGAQFTGPAGFREAQFSDFADFGWVRFTGEARFNWAQFTDLVSFGKAQFADNAAFDGTRFPGAVEFGGTRFGKGAQFAGSAFERRVTIGPLVVSGALVFDGAEFQQDLELNASSGELRCWRTRFGGRVDLNVRWAEIALDGATFVARSRLAGAATIAGNLDETSAQLCRVDRRLDAGARPRLVSLRYANVENLAVGNIDLRACRFFGAHGLDQLRIEADCEFAQPPRQRRYTRRRTLAEEHHWQAERAASTPGAARPSGWYPDACQPPRWLEPAAEVLDPARIAGLYRALRKALEDRNDEPGAADFYYGEMQMRRYAARPPHRAHDRAEPEADPAEEPSPPSSRGERWLLTLYWLTSGYALRASRAFTALVLMILLFAIGFWAVGFQDPGVQTRVRAVSASGTLLYERIAAAQRSTATEIADAAIYSAGTATSVIGAPERQLTRWGSVLRIVLRVLGPILIGLMLLSIRGRVKR